MDTYHSVLVAPEPHTFINFNDAEALYSCHSKGYETDQHRSNDLHLDIFNDDFFALNCIETYYLFDAVSKKNQELKKWIKCASNWSPNVSRQNMTEACSSDECVNFKFYNNLSLHT